MASAKASVALGCYRLVGSLFVRPLAPLILSHRVSRGKEERARLNERYGRAIAPRPDGPVVWIHGASVGETNAVLPLIREITATGRSVVFTTVTVTAARIASERLPAGAIHQYSPIDVAGCVRRFIDHWRPELAMFVESELWPMSIMSLSEANVPLIVVNGRLSQKSFEGWHRYQSIANAVFSKVGLCLAQTKEDGERYSALGVPSVVVTGNLKFDTPPPGADPEVKARLEADIGDRPVWLAASTHPGEEEIIATAHKQLVAHHPGLLTIIVPRHPERGAALRTALTAQGLDVACRSAGDPIAASTEIYLADTLGELGLFYRLAPVAFIGGSLVDHGGQNPIEPVVLGAAVLHGQHTYNFGEIYHALDADETSGIVRNADDLVEGASLLIGDPETREKHVASARAALLPFRGALDHTMNALAPVFDRGRKPASGGARLSVAGS